MNMSVTYDNDGRCRTSILIPARVSIGIESISKYNYCVGAKWSHIKYLKKAIRKNNYTIGSYQFYILDRNNISLRSEVFYKHNVILILQHADTYFSFIAEQLYQSNAIVYAFTRKSWDDKYDFSPVNFYKVDNKHLELAPPYNIQRAVAISAIQDLRMMGP